MDYSEVKIVIDLHTVDEINKYLSLGWEILEQYKNGSIIGPGHVSYEYHCIMAWTKDCSPVYPPSSKFDDMELPF